MDLDRLTEAVRRKTRLQKGYPFAGMKEPVREEDLGAFLKGDPMYRVSDYIEGAIKGGGRLQKKGADRDEISARDAKQIKDRQNQARRLRNE